jgi:hypothetical protein
MAASFLGCIPLRSPNEHDAMPAVAVEKIERVVHPGVKPRLHVLGDFANDVLLVAQPHELAARRRGPDRILALLAVVAVLHRNIFVTLSGAPRRGAESKGRESQVFVAVLRLRDASHRSAQDDI